MERLAAPLPELRVMEILAASYVVGEGRYEAVVNDEKKLGLIVASLSSRWKSQEQELAEWIKSSGLTDVHQLPKDSSRITISLVKGHLLSTAVYPFDLW
jgi:hypothetical protein